MSLYQAEAMKSAKEGFLLHQDLVAWERRRRAQAPVPLNWDV